MDGYRSTLWEQGLWQDLYDTALVHTQVLTLLEAIRFYELLISPALKVVRLVSEDITNELTNEA